MTQRNPDGYRYLCAGNDAIKVTESEGEESILQALTNVWPEKEDWGGGVQGMTLRAPTNKHECLGVAEQKLL